MTRGYGLGLCGSEQGQLPEPSKHDKTTSEIHKILEIAWLSEQLLGFEEDFYFNLLVTRCTSNCTLCPHCTYLCIVYLRTNSDLCHLHVQHKLIGFYNREEKCLQRGTDWVFK
jgi:hypothetical protein